MLIRRRRSRIYFLRKFFDYPLAINTNTVVNLGFWRMARIGVSYFTSALFPIRPENTLEQFFINRFGKELYKIFFQSYTEKVWGVPCSKISATWGRQRVKGLSIGKAIAHFLKKTQETSLIGQFLYPKYGPGQMWQEVAKIIEEKGGEIYMNHKVMGIKALNSKIYKVIVENQKTGEKIERGGDYFFSTMPVRELIAGLDPSPPREVTRVANGLQYRDFITVGLLVKKLDIGTPVDNWIYVQESDVRLGRIQIFNNWSPYMVRDPGKIWLGLKYFCNEGDDLWNKSDGEFIHFAIEELVKIEMIARRDVEDAILIRMPKAYPAYFGTYNEFPVIRNFLDVFQNLFLIGRNGMHRYNNQDHSMLTAMTAVENIIQGITSKDNIWDINTEEEYHEK